ncbi:hypothetical protein Bca101_038300 [Brassica carinata]
MFSSIKVERKLSLVLPSSSERSAGASILEVALKFEHRTSIEPVMDMLGPSLWDVWNTSGQACSGEPVFFQRKHSDQFPKLEPRFMHEKLLSSGLYGFLSSSTPSQLLGVPIILEGMISPTLSSSQSYMASHHELTSSIHHQQSPVASVPWNFLDSFPQSQRPDDIHHPSKPPNLSLFLKEPKLLELSQSNSNMMPYHNYTPNSLHHESDQTRSDQWVDINKALTNYPSKGFGNYWLSTTKTQPMKLASGTRTRKLKSGPLRCMIDSLLDSKIQQISASSQVISSGNSPSPSSPKVGTSELKNNIKTESGEVVMMKKQKINKEVMEGDGVQLSRMPSLDMDLIWDALSLP